MGTKMHCKSYLPGFHSMRDLNDDSSSSSWPLFYGDKMVANGQYCNGFMPKTSFDGYLGHDKDSLKQKMLEHEAVFKNQVLELHRLYRIQRDMMEEFKRKELHRDRSSMEPATSSSLQGPPVPSEEAQKLHKTVHLSDSSHGRTFVAGLDNFGSPSPTKENPAQPGGLPFRNGSITKNCEASDLRPLKVRKKLFDLQLPADEYVDPEEEENLQEYKKVVSSYSRNGDPTNGPQSDMKFFLGTREGAKIDPPNDASTSAGLADLNEPIQIEETTAPLSIDFLGHTSENGVTKTINQQAKSTTSYLSVAGEPLHVRGGISINSSIERQVNDKGWLSRVNGTGSSRGNLSSAMQGCQPDKSLLSSHPGQGTFDPPGMYSSGYNRGEKWKEGFQHGLESFDRRNSHSNYGHLEPIASRVPGSYPFFSSSSFSSSLFHSVSSWAQPSSSFPQNIPQLETPGNRVVAMSRHLQPSAQCRQSLEGNWHVDSSSKLARGMGSEPKSNRFYHAPSSGAKELQFPSLSTGFDRINCSRGDNVVFNRSTDHNFGNLPKGLYHADSKPALIINLNEALPKSLVNENVILQDLNPADGKSKPEDNFPTLSWIKPKPLHIDEVTDTRRSELSRELSYRDTFSNGLCIKSGTVRDLNQLYPSKLILTSSNSQIAREKEIAQPPTVTKILGYPIFEGDASENVLPSPASTCVNVDGCTEGRVIAGVERKNGIIDINVPCKPDEQTAADETNTENNSQEKVTHIKDRFDLNSCASDSEDPSPPGYEQNSASVRITLEIDLEVPLLMESEDDNTELKQKNLNEVSSQSFGYQNKEIQDEVFRDAAETLVAISSCPQEDTKDGICLPCEAPLGEALLWLADVSSDPNETVNTNGNESRVIERSSQQEIDDFEAIALQLVETKAEDYMPKPFLPELQKVEDAGARPLHTRTRRGHARRGRQWKDFRRDILPGLASLSRHEMTEDLQIFGGIMRATGHTWNSGLTRRNGTRNVGARGRRRAVVEAVPAAIATPLIQQLSSIEGGLEDRSLTGWGKTTRRPRRQRCPAGNPPTVVLT